MQSLRTNTLVFNVKEIHVNFLNNYIFTFNILHWFKKGITVKKYFVTSICFFSFELN